MRCGGFGALLWLSWTGLLWTQAAPGLDSRDPKELLAAARRYEEKGKSSWAEIWCRRILKLPDCPEQADAGFLLATLELKGGRFEAAQARLRGIRDRYGHSGARDLLARAETDATRRQRDLLENAERSFKSEKYDEARMLFTQAYELAPEKLTGAPFTPRHDIVPRIARCVDLIDDAYYKQKIQPVEREAVECAACKAGGGFLQCTVCLGTGIHKRLVRTLRGPPREVSEPCGNCGQIGWVFCSKCLGLEYAANRANLGPTEEKAVVNLVNHVRSLKIVNASLDSAMKEVEGVLLKLEASAALSFFRSLKARYSLSKEIKKALSQVPPDRDSIRAATSCWASAPNGIRARANFLLGYACEFAQYVRLFDMLRTSQKRDRVKFTEPPSASGTLAAQSVGPEVLSAFPDDGAASWVAVKATFDGYSEGPSDIAKGILRLSGACEHNVNFFIWRPEAAKHLERLEKGPWSARISGLAKAFPYGVREKCLTAPRGRRVVVVGRLLRDRLGFPRNWFEVWDLAVGLTPGQEQLLHSIEELVGGVDFAGDEAWRVASYIQVFHGLGVSFEGVDRKVRLDCVARNCPVGLVIDAVAKALDAKWYVSKGKVVFTRTPPEPELADIQSVLSELSKSAPPDREVSVRPSKGSAAPSPDAEEKLPEDTDGLARALEAASLAMRYDRAAKCCDALLAKLTDAAAKERLTRQKRLFVLFHALTHSVPVSPFAGAADLARIQVRNKAGEVRAQVVRILERKQGVVIIQTSYGARVQVNSDQIVREERLSAGEWLDERKNDISARLQEAEAAAPRDRAQKLYLLALAAKTSGLSEKATGYLERASAEEEFPWIVETYFPSRAVEMTRVWRLAEGKPVANVTEAEPKPVQPAPGATKPALPPLPANKALPSDPGKLQALARSSVADGKLLLSRALPGMDEAQANLHLALDYFKAARRAVDRLLEIDAQDVDAIHLSRDVTLLMTCVKDLGF